MQSGNEMLSSTDRAHALAEVEQLLTRIDEMAMSAEFNGRKLFSGEALNLHVGPGSNALLPIFTPFIWLRIYAMFGHAYTTTGNGSVAIVADDRGKRGSLYSVEVVTVDDAGVDMKASALTMEDGKTHLRITLGTDDNGALDPNKNSARTIARAINETDEFKARAHLRPLMPFWFNRWLRFRGDDPLVRAEGPRTFKGGFTSENTFDMLQEVTGFTDFIAGEQAIIGAQQNRLERVSAGLSSSADNLTAAASRISDADMSAEMMEFTRSKMLAQTGATMLAHASTMRQSVLQLLQ